MITNFKKKLLFIFSLFCVFTFSFSQQNIKSIQLRTLEKGNYSSIITFGKTIELSFDDLDGSTKEYWYKIEHMSYDWKPSTIFSSEYIEGFQENIITTIEQSFNTLQDYTNYRVQFPNNNTRITKSGNYLISITNSSDEVVFTRRLTLYENKTTVGVNVIPGRSKLANDDKQNVQFFINYDSNKIKQPNFELKTVVLQNDNWETAISDLSPQFFKPNQLIYKHIQKSSFWSGNEYLNFDNKQIRNSTLQIASVEKKAIYNAYLYPQEKRNNKLYTYFPDINGQFIVRTIEGQSNYTEADYALIHFTLEAEQIKDKEVYVYGAFNDFKTSSENRMNYNQKTDSYEVSILLKQGFYNYTFATRNGNNKINLHDINGSYSETENEYKVIVYHKAFGENYYKAIGLGTKTINPQK